MKKFYGVKRFTEAMIEAHESGNPMNPSGCRGHSIIFTYNENITKEYDGKISLSGNNIMALNAQQYCASVNAVLDGGGQVVSTRAFPIGSSIKCVIVRGDGDAAKTEKPQVEANSANSGAEAVNAEEPQLEIQPDVEEISETPEVGGEGNEEDKVEDASNELLEAAADESNDSGQADSDNAKPTLDFDLIEAMTKKEIDKHAESMGINLDGRQSKTKMIAQFKEEVGYEG